MTMAPQVLLIKLSSMGDVLHTLPAVSDLKRALPQAHLTWVVEESFAPISGWHPGVDQVVPTALRRWRKAPWSALRSGEVARLWHSLRQSRASHVLDAQGLLKSALLARLATGEHWGPDATWVRETLALPFYQHRVAIDPKEHVITRIRRLFATALGYDCPDDAPVFGLDGQRLPVPSMALETPYFLFLHGTAWTSKLWPESYWVDLTRRAVSRETRVLLPWGNESERLRAERIAQAAGSGAVVLPRLTLAELAALLRQARGAVGLDSGFAHLAAALGVPCVTLFGATNPDYSGISGPRQILLRSSHACAPCMRRQCPNADEETPHKPVCFQSIPPEKVWKSLQLITL